MTIVSIMLVPDQIVFRANAVKARVPTDKDEIERSISVVGKPIYRGTYPDTYIELLSESRRLALPDAVSFFVSPGAEIQSAEATIAYLSEYGDSKLGIAEPNQIAVTVNLAPKLFDDLWHLSESHRKTKLTFGVSFLAWKTDFSGHHVTWDIDQKGSSDQPLMADGFWFEVRVPNNAE